VKKYFAGLGELLVFFTKFYLKVKQLNFLSGDSIEAGENAGSCGRIPKPWEIP